MKINPRVLEMKGILYFVDTKPYHFGMLDLAVAEMLKGYLRSLDGEEQKKALGGIVSKAMFVRMGDGLGSTKGELPTVKRLCVPEASWAELDGKALAGLIEDAKAACESEAKEWRAEKRERHMAKTIAYLHEFVENLDGTAYVAAMPVEMAEFVTDCWLTVNLMG